MVEAPSLEDILFFGEYEEELGSIVVDLKMKMIVVVDKFTTITERDWRDLYMLLSLPLLASL